MRVRISQSERDVVTAMESRLYLNYGDTVNKGDHDISRPSVCCNGERNRRNGCSMSFQVFDFGANRKRECNFLLVINSNIGPIFPVSEILQVFC